MVEVWEDINGYRTRYKISNMGRVKSLLRGREIILKPRLTQRGYLRVALYRNRFVNDYFVHRLVAIAFVKKTNGHPEIKHIDQDDLPQVNHKDGNKLNNYAENLEWCDARHNQIHAISLGLIKYQIGEAHHKTPFKNEDIFAIREAYKNGESQCSIANRLGVSQSSISAIVRRETWIHI